MQYSKEQEKHLLRLRDMIMELKDLAEKREAATMFDYKFTVARVVGCCECELVELGVLTSEYMEQRRGELDED